MLHVWLVAASGWWLVAVCLPTSLFSRGVLLVAAACVLLVLYIDMWYTMPGMCRE